MTDYVNNHFAAHPQERVRPRIVCADGTSLSVQASSAHYCTPRETGAARYSTVEVGFPESPTGRATCPRSFGACNGGIWTFVPVSKVNAYIARHGGTKG